MQWSRTGELPWMNGPRPSSMNFERDLRDNTITVNSSNLPHIAPSLPLHWMHRTSQTTRHKIASEAVAVRQLDGRLRPYPPRNKPKNSPGECQQGNSCQTVRRHIAPLRRLDRRQHVSAKPDVVWVMTVNETIVFGPSGGSDGQYFQEDICTILSGISQSQGSHSVCAVAIV